MLPEVLAELAGEREKGHALGLGGEGLVEGRDGRVEQGAGVRPVKGYG